LQSLAGCALVAWVAAAAAAESMLRWQWRWRQSKQDSNGSGNGAAAVGSGNGQHWEHGSSSNGSDGAARWRSAMEQAQVGLRPCRLGLRPRDLGCSQVAWAAVISKVVLRNPIRATTSRHRLCWSSLHWRRSVRSIGNNDDDNGFYCIVVPSPVTGWQTQVKLAGGSISSGSFSGGSGSGGIGSSSCMEWGWQHIYC
jgi:hypothetical protein